MDPDPRTLTASQIESRIDQLGNSNQRLNLMCRDLAAEAADHPQIAAWQAKVASQQQQIKNLASALAEKMTPQPSNVPSFGAAGQWGRQLTSKAMETQLNRLHHVGQWGHRPTIARSQHHVHTPTVPHTIAYRPHHVHTPVVTHHSHRPVVVREEDEEYQIHAPHHPPLRGIPRAVYYADPVNEKYPINTPERIKAAWRYIHMARNQAPYTAKEVRIIQDRIIRAWQREFGDIPPAARRN